ncbi:probable protein phosphatase 2C 78 [Oryza brachyantha]|uniref:probable protein phosphatase 2C 78 n=1 Tax=Oryza brachyantha TaxID=4533 RepID=UPI001ADC5089|nr:probable protein phosphatase 2C 78 [Oryza brachyantha]
MLRWLARPAERCLGRGGGGGGGGGDGLMWHAELKPHASGEYSIAVAQANAKLEDQGQVVTSPAATFVGVYDGHGGPEASRFLSSRLFPHLQRFASEQGGMSTDAIKRAFHATEEEFLQLVKGSWIKQPQIASVGSCCLVGAIADNVLYVANLGDSRAVLGRRGPDGRQVVAERLSNDHNVAEEEVRKELTDQHPDDSRIVVYTRGVWRIKGIIQVSRSIGDVYLKKPEFARDPKFRQSVCPIPLKRPVMTAEPSIKEHQLRQQDLFLIFASDGLWEQLTDKAAVDIVFKNPRAGIAKRLVRAALTEAARKREMRYTDIKHIDRGTRRHFHDDITVVVLYLDRHKHGVQPMLGNRNSFRFTNAPVDIFSGSADEVDHTTLSS